MRNEWVQVGTSAACWWWLKSQTGWLGGVCRLLKACCLLFGCGGRQEGRRETGVPRHVERRLAGWGSCFAVAGSSTHSTDQVNPAVDSSTA